MNKLDAQQMHLLLYLYDELSLAEKAKVEAQLQINPTLQAQLASLKQLHEIIPQQPAVNPSAETLDRFRNALHHKIESEKSTTQNKMQVSIFPSFLASPALKIAFSITIGLGLLTCGFWFGERQSVQKNTPLLSRNIEVKSSGLSFESSELTEIDQLKYDAEIGVFEIKYATLNQVTLEAKPADPEIQAVLLFALQSSGRPAVRLRTVKALSNMVNAGQLLSIEIQNALIELVLTEENQGLKLQAINVLTNLTPTPIIQDFLIQTLLCDPNEAVRIGVFRALIKEDVLLTSSDIFLDAARLDSNSFISGRATQMIERLEARRPEVQK